MMSELKLLYPVPKGSWVTQTFTEHVQRAKQNGWCWTPGNCPQGVWYYGGIDYGVPTGTEVRAPLPGMIEAQTQSGGYGKNIRISASGGYYCVLAHLSSHLKKTGDIVKAGEVVGLSGNTGNSTGSHLHFEMRFNGVPFDPFPYLVESYEPSPAPPPPAEFELPEFEKPIWVQLSSAVTSWLNVRTKPNGLDVGDIRPGDKIYAYDCVMDGQDVWFLVLLPNGVAGWAAAYYNGETWLEVAK